MEIYRSLDIIKYKLVFLSIFIPFCLEGDIKKIDLSKVALYANRSIQKEDINFAKENGLEIRFNINMDKVFENLNKINDLISSKNFDKDLITELSQNIIDNYTPQFKKGGGYSVDLGVYGDGGKD